MYDRQRLKRKRRGPIFGPWVKRGVLVTTEEAVSGTMTDGAAMAVVMIGVTVTVGVRVVPTNQPVLPAPQRRFRCLAAQQQRRSISFTPTMAVNFGKRGRTRGPRRPIPMPKR
mgnify:FL=1